jgi:ParB-like chromosome segregation protein Spo0J
MKIEYIPVRDLRPYPNNARRHSKKQIQQIAKSIAKFGFCNPVLIDDTKQIIAGHGRVEAAKVLGIDAVPTCRCRI